MIQLVVSDIDGTLLPYGETVLSDDIFPLIQQLKERGIPFCPTSGRQYHSMRSLFPDLADEVPFVCENGGVVFGPGKENTAPIWASIPMERETALTLAQEILDLPQCELLITGAKYAYLWHGCPQEYVEHMRDFKGFQVKIIQDLAQVDEDILKVSAHCPQGTQSAEAHLGPTWSRVFHMAVAGHDWLDFTMADKGQGVLELCRIMGVSPQNVLAFGDNWNDAAMLSVVGHPYLMDSAHPELIKQFPTTCHRVEDVLRHWLDTGELL